MRSVLPFVLTPALFAAAGVSAQQGAAPPGSSAQMDKAIADYKSGDLNHARQELKDLLAGHPQDLRAALLLGYADIKLGRDAEACDVLASLEHGNESNLDLEYVLAYAMIRTDRVDEGVQRMEKVARARSAPDAWMIAGLTRFDHNQFKEARADAEAAIAINPKFPGAQTLLGRARYALSDNFGAEPALEAALRLDPNDYYANLYLGVVRSRAGDYEAAKSLLELSLVLKPGVPVARLELARVYQRLGNYAEAIAILESLEKANPDWAEPHFFLSSLYFIVNRPEDGRRERVLVQKFKDQLPVLPQTDQP